MIEMNPEELDKEFTPTDFNAKGNIIPDPATPATQRRKRRTIADVEQRVDELTELIDVEIHGWLHQLDTRVRHFENAEAENLPATEEDLKRRLDQLEGLGFENLPSFMSDTAEQFRKLKATTQALVQRHLDSLDDVKPLPPPAAQELEFAKPPRLEAEENSDAMVTEHVAEVCESMLDVLMVCRLLKASKCMYDSERSYILNLSCEAAGIEATPGLYIRSGIKMARN